MPDVQRQLADLRRKIESLELLHGTLGEDAYQKAKTDLEAQLRPLIETAGDPAFLGDVKLDHGSKFVGHDDKSITFNITDPEVYSLDELLSTYYRSLANECRRLPLGIIDLEFVRTSGEEPVSLPDIYVDLDVVSPTAESQEDERTWALRLLSGKGSERISVLDAITQPEQAQHVLLGEAGSGKATFTAGSLALLGVVRGRTSQAPAATAPSTRIETAGGTVFGGTTPSITAANWWGVATTR